MKIPGEAPVQGNEKVSADKDSAAGRADTQLIDKRLWGYFKWILRGFIPAGLHSS